LGSVTLRAPIENPPSIWAAAANYRAHAAEMLAASGGPDRSRLGKDELMAEFFLKPSSSIIGPGGTILLPKISKDVDYEAELCAVIGTRAPRERGPGARARVRLHHLLGHQPARPLGTRPPEHAQHPQGLRYLHRARAVDRHARRAARAAGRAHRGRAERQAGDDRAHGRH